MWITITEILTAMDMIDNVSAAAEETYRGYREKIKGFFFMVFLSLRAISKFSHTFKQLYFLLTE